MYCSYLLLRRMFALQILLSDANLEPIMPDSINECLSTRHTSAFQGYILGRGVSGDFLTRPLHIEYCVQLLQLVAKSDAYSAGVPGDTTTSKCDVISLIFTHFY
jgi:hypothetical protein